MEALEPEPQKLREQVTLLEVSLQEARQQVSDTKRILLGIIDAIDAFERVFESIRAKEDQVTPQMKLWIGNFRTVLRLLSKVLADHGAFPIQNLEGGFDAHWHQAFETVGDSTEPDGTILQEIQKGYVWRDQILRKASVVVACKAATASQAEKGLPTGTVETEAGSNNNAQATDGQTPVAGTTASSPNP